MKIEIFWVLHYIQFFVHFLLHSYLVMGKRLFAQLCRTSHMHPVFFSTFSLLDLPYAFMIVILAVTIIVFFVNNTTFTISDISVNFVFQFERHYKLFKGHINFIMQNY